MFWSDLAISPSSHKIGSYVELLVCTAILYYLLQPQALAIPRTMFPVRMEQTPDSTLGSVVCVFFSCRDTEAELGLQHKLK